MAAHLGIWNVDKLAEEMPAPVLAEWIAYYMVEPFGEERADVRNAINTSAIVNVIRKQINPKNKAIPAEDFLPNFEEQETATQEEMIAQLATIAAAMGGKVKTA